MPYPPTPSQTASNTPTPSITASVTPTYSPTGTACPDSTPTQTPSNTATLVTPTQTSTPTKTPTQTINLTPTQTPSQTMTPSPVVYIYAGGSNTWNNSTTACSNKTCARPYYRDVPSFANGLIVYDNSSLTIPFNGGGNWVAIDTSTGAFCSGTGWRAIQIDTNGIILNSVTCP